MSWLLVNGMCLIGSCNPNGLQQRCQSVKFKKKIQVVKKTEISYNFVQLQIGLNMCKLALAKKLKTDISASI